MYAKPVIFISICASVVALDFVDRRRSGANVKRDSYFVRWRKVLRMFSVLIFDHFLRHRFHHLILTVNSTDCTIKLKNTSSSPVEFLEVTVDSLLEPSLQRQIVRWSQQTIQDQLPLLVGATADLPLHLFGASNFLVQNMQVSNLQGDFFVFAEDAYCGIIICK